MMRGKKNIQLLALPSASLVCYGKMSTSNLDRLNPCYELTHRIHDLRPALHRHHLERGQHGQTYVVERADAGVRTLKEMGGIHLQMKELVWFGCFYIFLLPQTMLPSNDQIANQSCSLEQLKMATLFGPQLSVPLLIR